MAAHISAASPGGPRYDPALTELQPGALDNGVWLCANDATAIDDDEVRYPKELLVAWREAAETLARQEQGRRLRGVRQALVPHRTAITDADVARTRMHESFGFAGASLMRAP